MNNLDNTNRNSNAKIAEALELLNEAAKEKGEEVQHLLKDRYSHIKQAVVTGAQQGKVLLDKAQHVAQDAIVEGKKKAAEIDKSVHENPWPYLGGVALFSLVLGYFLGTRRKD